MKKLKLTKNKSLSKKILLSIALASIIGIGFISYNRSNINYNKLKGEVISEVKVYPGVIKKIKAENVTVTSKEKSNKSYTLEKFFDVYLGGKIMQNFEVTDDYIYASYKAKNYKNKKTSERLLSSYENNATTTIKQYKYDKSKGKVSNVNYMVLRGAGHSQLFDVTENDTIYSNAKPFFDSEANLVASPAFQVFKYPSNQYDSNSYPKKNSSYAYSNNNGATVVYNTEALIKSDSYYFNINNNLSDYSASLLHEDYYNLNNSKYKDNRKRNIQFAVDEKNKLIAVHPYKVRKIYIFKMDLKSDYENKPIKVVDLCKDYKNDYSCTQGDGNQGIAFHDKTIYIALGGPDINEKGEYVEKKAPKIVKIELKNDNLNESNRETLEFNFREALKDFCKNKFCDKNNDEYCICYSEKELNKKITLEVEGISASKNGVYLGFVYKKNGGKRFNYIYKLTTSN